MNYIEGLVGEDRFKLSKAIRLKKENNYTLYMVNNNSSKMFSNNIYFIVTGKIVVIFDAGGVDTFDIVRESIKSVTNNKKYKLFTTHQDPDVIGSLPKWNRVEDVEVELYSSARTMILLDHYLDEPVRIKMTNYEDSLEIINNYTCLYNKFGIQIHVVKTPFVHFSGSVVFIIDDILISGDLFATVRTKSIVVTDNKDWYDLKLLFDVFSSSYFPCNKALRLAYRNMTSIRKEFSAILPQHGYIIPERFTKKALEYVSTLKCGMDFEDI